VGRGGAPQREQDAANSSSVFAAVDQWQLEQHAVESIWVCGCCKVEVLSTAHSLHPCIYNNGAAATRCCATAGVGGYTGPGQLDLVELW
jgi:hypothetical protein